MDESPHTQDSRQAAWRAMERLARDNAEWMTAIVRMVDELITAQAETMDAIEHLTREVEALKRAAADGAGPPAGRATSQRRTTETLQRAQSVRDASHGSQELSRGSRRP